MNNQLENTPVQKVLLSEKINRFAAEHIKAIPRRSITEQMILHESNSRFANDIFYGTLLSVHLGNPILCGVLFLAGSVESTVNYIIEDSKLPEHRKS